MTKKQENGEVVNPFSENFTPIWELWKRYKKDLFKFTYKSWITEQSALNKLVRISGGDESVAIEIIEDSMANQWEGLFPIKINSKFNGKETNGSNPAAQRESVNEALNKRFANGR